MTLTIKTEGLSQKIRVLNISKWEGEPSACKHAGYKGGGNHGQALAHVLQVTKAKFQFQAQKIKVT